MDRDVFISHSSKDKAVADGVCAALEGTGMRCWIAPRDILSGEDWASSIMRGIAECRLMVLVFSAASNDSPYILREVECAVRRGLPIIMMRIEDAAPAGGLEFFLYASHWMDALTLPLEVHLLQLASNVRVLLKLDTPLPLLPRAAVPDVPPPHPPGAPATAPAGVNVAGMSFVTVPAGEFDMGTPPGELGHDSNETLHHVTLTRPFLLAACPVTQAQWEPVMGSNPSRFRSDNRPVENVSWNDAAVFCEKLGAREKKLFRLPTEAEWEYACRAGTASAFSFGNDQRQLGDFAWFVNNSTRKTHDVGAKKPNPWGLYDMHGNVMEWCSDWYDDYGTGDATDPRGPAEAISEKAWRVLRGGSWNGSPRFCRSGFRSGFAPDYPDETFGLRLALDL